MDHMRPLVLRLRSFVSTEKDTSSKNNPEDNRSKPQSQQNLESETFDPHPERRWPVYALIGSLSILFLLCFSIRSAIQTDVSYNHAAYQLPSLQPVHSMEDWHKIRQLLSAEMHQLADSLRNNSWDDLPQPNFNHEDSSHRQVTLQRQVHVRLAHSALGQLESLELTDIAINTHSNLVSVLLTFEKPFLTGQYTYQVLNNKTIPAFKNASQELNQEESGHFKLQANLWKVAWFAELHRFEPQTQQIQLRNIELRSFYDSKRLRLQLRPDSQIANRMDIENTTTSAVVNSSHLINFSISNNSLQRVNSQTNISAELSELHVTRQPPSLTLAKEEYAESQGDSALHRVIQECAAQRLRQLLEARLNQYLRSRFGCNGLFGPCEISTVRPETVRGSSPSISLDHQPLSSILNAPAARPTIAFHVQNMEDVLRLNPNTLGQWASKYRNSEGNIAPVLLQPATQSSLAQQLAAVQHLWPADILEQAIRDRLDGHLERILNQALYEMHRERVVPAPGRWVHSGPSSISSQYAPNLNVAHTSSIWPINSDFSRLGLSALWSTSQDARPRPLPLSSTAPEHNVPEFNVGDSETFSESEEDADVEHGRSKRQVPCERGQELDEYVDSLFRFASRVVRAMEPFALPNATIDLPEYNMKLFLHSGGATRAYTLMRKRAAWVYCTNESVSLGLTVGFDDLRIKYKYRAIKDWSLLWDGELEAKLEHTKLQVQFTQTTPDEDSEVAVMQRVDRIRIWRVGHMRVMIKGLGNLTQGVSMLLTNMINQNLAQLDPTLRRLELEAVEIANRLLKNLTIPFFSII